MKIINRTEDQQKAYMKMLEEMGQDASWMEDKSRVDTVIYYSKLSGIRYTKKAKRWARRDPEEVEQIIDMRLKGYTLKEIGQYMLLSDTLVNNILHENDILIGTTEMKKRRRENNLDEKYDEMYKQHKVGVRSL